MNRESYSVEAQRDIPPYESLNDEVQEEESLQIQRRLLENELENINKRLQEIGEQKPRRKVDCCDLCVDCMQCCSLICCWFSLFYPKT